MAEGHPDLVVGEGNHYALLVLVVGVHLLLEVLPVNLGVGVRALSVLLVPLEVVVGVLCVLKVWVVESVQKRT